MLSPLRNRFGIPGVISVIALVFAMLGGAYAASNDSGSGDATASAKKKAKKGQRGPRGFRGKPGPAGPEGPAGPQGAKGDKGDAGSNGSNGTNGTDGAPGLQGLKGATGPAGADGDEGATGPAGPTGATGFSGFTATLPSGETETGAWGGLGMEVQEDVKAVTTSISFPIPLAAPLDAAHVIWSVPLVPISPNCNDGEGEAPSASNPEADPGYLCVFIGEGAAGEVTAVRNPATGTAGAAKVGAEILGEPHPFSGVARGTWAVTAP